MFLLNSESGWDSDIYSDIYYDIYSDVYFDMGFDMGYDMGFDKVIGYEIGICSGNVTFIFASKANYYFHNSHLKSYSNLHFYISKNQEYKTHSWLYYLKMGVAILSILLDLKSSSETVTLSASIHKKC